MLNDPFSINDGLHDWPYGFELVFRSDKGDKKKTMKLGARTKLEMDEWLRAFNNQTHDNSSNKTITQVNTSCSTAGGL